MRNRLCVSDMRNTPIGRLSSRFHNSNGLSIGHFWGGDIAQKSCRRDAGHLLEEAGEVVRKLEAQEMGGFEKVGEMGRSLPSADGR